MARDSSPRLQLAIDVLRTSDALRLAEATYPHFDIAEIGTPLIIEEGLAALEALKSRFPDKQYLADLKIMDAGFIEASSGFTRGADIVTVLAAADDQTISGALEAAEKHHGKIMADLINVPDPLVRALVECCLAVAGGLNLDNVPQAVDCGADIVVVGGAIIAHDDPGAMAEQIIARIRPPA